MLGLPATDPSRYSREPVKPGDPDDIPNRQRLLHVVADRIEWQTALEQLAAEPPRPVFRQQAGRHEHPTAGGARR